MIREYSELELQERIDSAMASVAMEIRQNVRQEIWHGSHERKEQEKELYLAKICFIRELLEYYRQASEDSWIRNTVNSLIRAHRDICTESDRDKTDHNITVLRYLVKDILPDKEICARLEITADRMETGIERTARRMSVLLYGIEGLDPRWLNGGFTNVRNVTPKK